MKVIIFGATGMVGQSALRECLLDDGVEQVLTLGRSSTGKQHPKLREILLPDLIELSRVEQDLTGFDACFFCLGVSAAGLKEEEYRSITYDLTLSVAEVLARLNPDMTFIYVSGSGTDSTEKGRSMWARVKGETENALLRLPFQQAYMFRPGGIIPLYGVKSKTRLYQTMYDLLKPLNRLVLKSSLFITSEQLGKAMIIVTQNGFAKPILESKDLKRISFE